MSEECPNCRQLTNTSFSRLVKDSCGHTKCRMCLLYEEQGCKACNNEHRIQNIGNYDCPQSSIQVQANTSDTSKCMVPSEEIIFPLELVINKDSKQKVDYAEYSSVDCVTIIEPYHENHALDIRKDVYELSTKDINDDTTSNKLYIPKVEPSDVTANICTQLDNNERNSIDATASYKKDTNINDTVNSSNSINNKAVKNLDRSHISIIPGNPERYKCNICGKVFRNKKGKCYHDACITGIKPYQCKLCDRSFVKRSHFEYHERVHTGYKPFKCNQCDKAFPQQNKLNRHMYSHSKEKNFACTKCKKAYSKRDDLKIHLALHNSTATYSCKSCGKVFRILTNLKRHMRTHTSERPHICDQCGKSFKDKSLLIRHKRTHEKDRPFSCAHCNRVFLSKSELRRHLTVHSGEKPFSCEYCQTMFRRKDNLKRHIRHHHTEDSSFASCRVQKTVQDKGIKLGKTKQPNSKQKQKLKKSQKITSSVLLKSPTKVSIVYVSPRDQINSRLDSMGNITPVIRVTGELSNAVPVINGPISIKQPEDKTVGKKTFTYTEPIPLAEAVVLNRQIEEKIYSQNVSNHSYYFRNYSNCNDKPYSSTVAYIHRNNLTANNCSLRNGTCENVPEDLTPAVQTNFICQSADSIDYIKNFPSEKQLTKQSSIENKDNVEQQQVDNFSQDVAARVIHDGTEQSNNINENIHLRTPANEEQLNYVPTIQNYSISQPETSISKEQDASKISHNPGETKDHELTQRKHWRRRMAEIIKPTN